MAAYARVPDVIDRSGSIASRGCEALLVPASLAPAFTRIGGGSLLSYRTWFSGCGWCCKAWKLWLVGFSQPRVSRRRRVGKWQFHPGILIVAMAMAVQSGYHQRKEGSYRIFDPGAGCRNT